ncbi:MAG: hypothetical protein MEQ84_06700 [Mesorhizobium sp.]|nr:hypothetical protein [Mesorhizobium sp.]
MDPNDREQLIDVSFRFVSWLRKNFPEVKDRVRDNWPLDGFAERIRETPTAFWGDVGAQDYEILTRKSENGESILDRVVALVKQSPPGVQNEILVGFAEAHMFPRPNSPLAGELAEALGHRRIGDVF